MNLAALKAALEGGMENAVVAMTPGGIEAQEAAGQRALCAAAQSLPKEIRPKGGREYLTGLDFKFGADVDDLFVSCEFPKGWRLQATSHSMHSDLLDEKGRVRGGVFYKAAFYDRNAYLYLKSRYFVDGYADAGESGYKTTVNDGDAILRDFGNTPRADYKAHDKLRKEAEAWLAQQYPDHRNPFAYWN